ncbi:hypothetical protein MMUR_28820 [Mycolicibacterium murale]|uniref:SnoaL-like domain-containing protein n=1 Tax=Mycolicibacterium murale TaxID=182220 RepID=A0A7I9WNA8_9MYCO|nr:nuclear transport factor 2 family protein [Mycolicibacterium murale]MCV7180331.1 nuclear transport factor 2 family protein [Mycolicibacterium murale]GFG58746.1 hypothetical protein MMUR_28820 [Mycolicibacterium murale]
MNRTDDTTTDILARLDRLESAEAIRRLKATYMQWCDDRRGRDIGSLFWEDGTWEGAGASTAGTVTGAAAIGAMFEEAPKRLTFTVHYLTNESITVCGDTATGAWKLLEPCTFEDSRALWQGGRYEDTFERRGGEWRFTRMKLYLEYRTPYEEGWLRNKVVTL